MDGWMDGEVGGCLSLEQQEQEEDIMDIGGCHVMMFAHQILLGLTFYLHSFYFMTNNDIFKMNGSI